MQLCKSTQTRVDTSKAQVHRAVRLSSAKWSLAARVAGIFADLPSEQSADVSARQGTSGQGGIADVPIRRTTLQSLRELFWCYTDKHSSPVPPLIREAAETGIVLCVCVINYLPCRAAP